MCRPALLGWPSLLCSNPLCRGPFPLLSCGPSSSAAHARIAPSLHEAVARSARGLALTGGGCPPSRPPGRCQVSTTRQRRTHGDAATRRAL
eukprot:5945333-Prymnesium_polylepis.1